MKLTIKGKTYTSGKLTRKKLLKLEEIKEVLTDNLNGGDIKISDYDLMLTAIQFYFDNQFTSDDYEEEFGLEDVVYHYQLIIVNPITSATEKMAKFQKKLQMGK